MNRIINSPESGDHVLILNIGGNPLPNYIIAKYAIIGNNPSIPKPSIVILIHSDNTQEFAENIITNLIRELGVNRTIFKRISIGNTPRNLESIKRPLSISLGAKLDRSKMISSIHFNYTGATKSMMLGGYIILSEYILSILESNRNFKFLLSDLDPDSFKIRLKTYLYKGYNLKQKTEIIPEGPIDLRDSIKFSYDNIRTLFALHNIYYKNPKDKNYDKTSSFYNPEKAQLILRMINNSNRALFKAWRDGASYYNNKKKLPHKFYDLKNLLLNTNLNYVRTELNKHTTDRQGNYIRLGADALTYISGGWLEDFIYSSIKGDTQIAAAIDFMEKGVIAYYGERKMELDTILINGYQLIIVSVTTTTKLFTAKRKAFEVLYRTQQLGGEHAKAIFISLLDKQTLDMLRRDLSLYIDNGRLYLFGIDPTKDMLAQLSASLITLLKKIFVKKPLKSSIVKVQPPSSVETVEEGVNLLILNIGRNPLPNFIVAKYTLIEERHRNKIPCPDKFVLLHSNRTKNVAKNIRDCLINDELIAQNGINLDVLNFFCINLENNQRDLGVIINEVLSCISKNSLISSIHLNYTGGTKPMALGSFLACQEYQKKFIGKTETPKLIYSDLDINNFKLIGYCNNIWFNYPNPGENLRDKIILSIPELLTLHGLEVDEEFVPRELTNFENNLLENLVINKNISDINFNFRYQGLHKRILSLVTVGYQLFLIEATTLSKARDIKKEAFEARYRAELLGGEQAKALLFLDLPPYVDFNNIFNLVREDLREFNAIQSCLILNTNQLNLLNNIFITGSVRELWF